MQRFELMLTNLVVTLVAFVELFAEKAKWFCVEFTLKCISNVENGQLKDTKRQPKDTRAALCSCAYRDVQFLIIWKTNS